jgi:hypothetical protein
MGDGAAFWTVPTPDEAPALHVLGAAPSRFSATTLLVTSVATRPIA